MLAALQAVTARHQHANFDSGEPGLDDWLRRRAAKNQVTGSSRTYVVCEADTVIGYCCLAIHKDHHQKGIGTAPLGDAIRRAIQAAEIAGVTALLVHALSEPARRFYPARGFVESPI